VCNIVLPSLASFSKSSCIVFASSARLLMANRKFDHLLKKRYDDIFLAKLTKEFPIQSRWIEESTSKERYKYYLIQCYPNEIMDTPATQISFASVYGDTAQIDEILHELDKENVSLSLNAKRSFDKMTPLHLAIANNERETVKYLLSKGANTNEQDDYGNSPLHWTCRVGDEDLFDLLVKKDSSLLQLKNNDGKTILHTACEFGYPKLVQKILKTEASVQTTDVTGMTPLHLASENGHKAVVKLLLDNDAELETKDKKKRTPLHCACENGHVGAVSQLLKKNANMETTESQGRTSVFVAYRYRHLDVVKLLLDKGANLEATDNSSRTLLLVAYGHGEEEIVQLLLDKGANLEATDKRNETLFHLACSQGDEATVRQLVAYGVNIHAKNRYNEAPVEIALEEGFKNIADYLSEIAKSETTDINDQLLLTFQSMLAHYLDNKTQTDIASVKQVEKFVKDFQATDTDDRITFLRQHLEMRDGIVGAQQRRPNSHTWHTFMLKSINDNDKLRTLLHMKKEDLSDIKNLPTYRYTVIEILEEFEREMKLRPPRMES